jgi:hypothetical protein|uniref:Uncharacterized protein n=1 Tax=Siphoviridae sp. ct8Hx23 TaxID=2825360 RepID=A0A8S5P6Z3_9CAUD|nr:MAG TPA: hypothetical protein [Siphoviridae sp. ct8Hx23]
MDIEEKKRRADEAAFILQSGVFRETFEALDAECVSQWRWAQDQEVRERAWRTQRVLDLIRDRLQDIIHSYTTIKEKHHNA